MTPELTALTLAALLQVGQFALMSISANLQLGTAKTMSPRDPARLGGSVNDILSPINGRIFRAFNNHFEGLILFTISCLVITLADKSSPLTALCAYAYLIARIAYVPAYVFGWVPWRSLIWCVGMIATIIMLITALV